jgi:ABC-2 type transport system permease protein
MFRLVHNEFLRTSIVFTRYFGESLSGLLVLTLIFYGIFLGSTYLAGPVAQFGNRLESLVVGFIAWTLFIVAFSGIGNGMSEEAQTGVLEQVFMAAHPPLVVFLARALAGLLFVLILNSLVLAILVLVTGVTLQLPWEIVPVVATVLLAAYGLGFMLGAVALVWKRITQLISLFQFALLFVLVTPFEQLNLASNWVLYMLPAAPGVAMMRETMARGEPLEIAGLMFSALNGAAFFALGALLFNWSVRYVRKKGLTSGY